MNRWLVVAPLSVALGWLLSAAHVPAAWILGAIIVSGSVALVSGRELRLPKRLFSLARGTIGVLAAVPLIGIPGRELATFLIPGLAAAAFTIGLAFVGGLVLANHGVSRETGVLSLLAGGASVMPAIAEEVGADVRYVALSQYLRLLTVSITLPLVASLMAPGSAEASPAAAAEAVASPWMWLLVPALVVTGIPLGKVLHLPNASVFGPMLLTVLVGTLADFSITPPMPLTVASLIAIGWLAGGGLDIDALKRFSRMLPATMLYIVGLMAACAGVGWVMSKWLGISLYEGYLATTPGALETVLALSAEGGAGPAVIALQLIRLICVLVFAAYLPRILRAL
ncbi:AbrB family transcriptional regulator [Corynebacterium sp. Q4381]|uniref:AbrB family transcriptional regulator n=1 Tax=Corynebacterium sp. Marseille-Q4381 TaxID=3121597 RepID=UPI002FE6488E